MLQISTIRFPLRIAIQDSAFSSIIIKVSASTVYWGRCEGITTDLGYQICTPTTPFDTLVTGMLGGGAVTGAAKVHIPFVLDSYCAQ